MNQASVWDEFCKITTPISFTIRTQPTLVSGRETIIGHAVNLNDIVTVPSHVIAKLDT
jgi:hypothetical protein